MVVSLRGTSELNLGVEMKSLLVILTLTFASTSLAQSTNVTEIVERTQELLFQRTLVGPDGDTVKFDMMIPLRSGYVGTYFEAERTHQNGYLQGIGLAFYEKGELTKVNLRMGARNYGTYNAELRISNNLYLTATDDSLEFESIECRERSNKTICRVRMQDGYVAAYKEQ
jgi:hypothetical protein